MTDHKFTDDEIIKALECCRTIDGNDCQNCAYHGKIYEIGHGGCTNDLVGDALALINRQKAEIERLQAVHADMTESLQLAAEANKDMQTEIERLNKEVDRLSQCVLYHDGIVSDLERDLFNAKAEAIKEFAKKIKTDAERICDDNYIEGALIKYVDTLVKEMTEGKNESQSTKTVGGIIPARSGEA